MRADSGRFQALPSADQIQGFLNRHEPDAEQGFNLDDLAKGAVLEVETRHHTYYIKNLADGRVEISGHPEYCPEPVAVEIIGSDFGTGIPRVRVLTKGARLEFFHPQRGFVRTSSVLAIRELSPVS